MKKQQTNPDGGTRPNSRLNSLKNVEVTKDRERLRSCARLKEAKDASSTRQETESGPGSGGDIAINGQLARCEVMVLCGIKVALSVFDHCTVDVRECHHS